MPRKGSFDFRTCTLYDVACRIAGYAHQGTSEIAPAASRLQHAPEHAAQRAAAGAAWRLKCRCLMDSYVVLQEQLT